MKRILSVLMFLLVAVSGVYSQKQVAYQPAQYPGGQKELNAIVAKEMILSKKLFKAMVDENISEVIADAWLIVNSKGKVVGIDLVDATHPLLNEDCFPKIVKNLKDITFIPGSIDGESATTAIFIKGLRAVMEPVVN